jgi:hypothetical protein
MRTIISLLLTATLCFVSLGFACNKSSNDNRPPQPISREQGIAFAKDIAAGLRAAQPLVAQLKPAAGALLAQAIPIADKVIAAVEASDPNNVIDLLNQLIPIIDAVVGQFSSNVKVLTFMALADIGIHFLINHSKEIFGTVAVARTMKRAGRAARSTQPADAVTTYAERPTWGCQYHPEKCR